MAIILKWLAGAAGPYILAALAALILGLCGSIWVLSVRLDAAQNEVARAEIRLDRCKLAQDKAAAESAQRGAETGAKAISNFQEKEDEDRPVVVRTVTRIVRQCSGESRNPAVPTVAGSSSQADAGVGDAGDRAYAEAIGRDIQSCSTALNQCSEVIGFVCANGGCPQ